MTRRAGPISIVIGLLLTTSACYEHTFAVGGGAPHGPVVYDHWQNFWLAGLIGHTKIDLEEVCPSGRATVEARQTFLNGLVSALTSGIYTPTTLKIRCADGRRAALELSEEDVARIVADDGFVDWVRQDAPERVEDVLAAQDAPAP